VFGHHPVNIEVLIYTAQLKWIWFAALRQLLPKVMLRGNFLAVCLGLPLRNESA
jgi:hypothetical protein